MAEKLSHSHAPAVTKRTSANNTARISINAGVVTTKRPAQTGRPAPLPPLKNFATHRREILNEIRHHVFNDAPALEALLTGDTTLLDNPTSDAADFNRRKWRLLLHYYVEADFELEDLCYMEFRKIYLVANR